MGTNKSRSATHITESHPNPHGEQQVSEMPLQTDHREATTENVARTPSTLENQMSPSMNGPLEDPTTDSMFNLADRQTRELLGQDTGKNRSRGQGPNSRKKKARDSQANR